MDMSQSKQAKLQASMHVACMLPDVLRGLQQRQLQQHGLHQKQGSLN